MGRVGRSAFWLAVIIAGCSSYSAADESAIQDGGTTEDAGPIGTRDAGSDAPTANDADAERGPFCASFSPAPFFCADFDQGKPVGYGWDENLGGVEIDPSTSTSPPASLKGSPTDAGATLLRRSFGDDPKTPKSEQRFSLSVKTDAPGFAIVGRLINEAQASCTINLEHTAPNVWRIAVIIEGDDAGNYDHQAAMTAFPVEGQWSRVEIVVTKIPDGATVSAKVDGVDAILPFTMPCPALGDTDHR